MPMNRALIGKEYRGLEPVMVSADGARAYAAATNAKLPAYEGPSASAPPMFGVAFSVKALSAPLFDPELKVVPNLAESWVIDDVRRHAAGRPGNEGPYGWRVHLKSQELFVRYCSRHLIETISTLGRSRQGAATETGT